MYCAACGSAVPPGLSYCNHCGARVANSQSETKSSEVQPGTMVGAIVFTFVFGLVAISMLLGVAKVILRFEPGLVLGFGLVSFFVMLIIEAVFIRLLLKGKRASVESTNQMRSGSAVTKELRDAAPQRLGEPIPSVTEHTTRAFHPIYEPRDRDRS